MQWRRRDRFDLAAKAAGNPSQAELSLMLRPLLVDRFRLAIRFETRERPIYVLTLARRDGGFGPGLRRSNSDCSGPVESRPDGCTMISGPGTVKAHGVPIAALQHMVTGWVDDHREVSDQTGVTGTFDMEMQWTPSRMPGVPADASPEIARALRTIDPDGPSLFTALREQLGRKLEPGRAPVAVIVIDRVDHLIPD